MQAPCSLHRSSAGLRQQPFGCARRVRVCSRPPVPAQQQQCGSRVSLTCTHAATAQRDATAPRFIQHKAEAFWFYRFLSMVYDHIVNPGHWTEDMREDALQPAQLNKPNLKVRSCHAWAAACFMPGMWGAAATGCVCLALQGPLYLRASLA
jgi:hypothetical protein